MKKILITGANSYIGTSFEKWVSQYKDEYIIDTICVKNESWKTSSFSNYDVVFHVAGLAHVSTDPNLEQLYYKINRDLAIEVAKKCKNDGVKQFIFMSSIIVYGDSSLINKKRIITSDTIPTPTNFYGNSKLEAEKGILKLQNDSFKIVIIRPPMIYGKECKGNYKHLVKVANAIPVFPDIKNERSMLHIDNLCEFIKLMIDNNEKGIFFPQNEEYVQTSDMVKTIATMNGKKIKLVKFLNPLIILLSKKVRIINKVFGNLVYDKDMSIYSQNYCIRSFVESISSSKEGE